MELWLQLINAESEEEFEMLNQTGVAPIQEAVYVLYQMSEDEKIQEMARMREKAWLVEMLNTRGAREEGRAEGRAEGEAMLKRAAQNMRDAGMTEAEIRGFLGIDDDEAE
jgi:predicted transposase YdaD